MGKKFSVQNRSGVCGPLLDCGDQPHIMLSHTKALPPYYFSITVTPGRPRSSFSASCGLKQFDFVDRHDPDLELIRSGIQDDRSEPLPLNQRLDSIAAFIGGNSSSNRA